MDKNKRNWIIAIIVVFVIVFGGGYLMTRNKNNTEQNKNNTEQNNNNGGIVKGQDNVKIVANAASKLTLEDYSTSEFSMKKPQGWKVETGGTGMYYAIKVYDPNETNNQIFLMLKMQPLLKSTAGKAFWQNYYKLSGNNSQYKVFADAVVLEKPTTEGFYQKFNDITTYMNNIESTLATFKFPKYTNFTVNEKFESSASMKAHAIDSKVLRATFTGDNNKDGEGLFMASVVNFGNQYTNGIDILYYMVYDIMAITSNKDMFINYEDILTKCINSIEFTDSYVKKTIDDGNAQTKRALELNASVQKAFDSYMSAWERRNKTYDIMSQKQSDATLGYERVYDTDTGEVYKAYNGFTDDYDGSKYKSITDDMYTTGISGYIEK